MFTTFKILMVSAIVASGMGANTTAAISSNEVPIHQIKHEALIKELILCESGGRNISRPDSNGFISDGILQYNRDRSGKVGSGTWAEFSKASGIVGSPLIRKEAIEMTDWALDHGFVGRWSCAHLKNNWRKPLKPEFARLNASLGLGSKKSD